MEGLTEEIMKLGRQVLAVEADVTKSEETKRMAKEAIDRFGRIDVLVNNAGIIIVEPFMDIREENWDKVLGVNLKGTFLCCQAVAPHMVEQKNGKIINMSSVVGKKGSP